MALPRSAHTATLADDCLVRNDWVCPEYVRTRSDDLLAALTEHVAITVVSVAIGFVIAAVLAVLVRRSRRLRGALLGASTVLYTVPSLVLFGLLLPLTGLTATTVVVGLVLYTLTIAVRGVLVGLDSVPTHVREAAVGMGYGRWQLLRSVELPLALPAIFAALRVATVSTVALTTIGMMVGHGGLGNLIFRGLRSNFRAEVLTASVLCVLLALLADLLVLAGQRWAMPWRRTV